MKDNGRLRISHIVMISKLEIPEEANSLEVLDPRSLDEALEGPGADEWSETDSFSGSSLNLELKLPPNCYENRINSLNAVFEPSRLPRAEKVVEVIIFVLKCFVRKCAYWIPHKELVISFQRL